MGKKVPYQTQPWPLLPQQVIGVGIVGLGYEFRVWKRYKLSEDGEDRAVVFFARWLQVL